MRRRQIMLSLCNCLVALRRWLLWTLSGSVWMWLIVLVGFALRVYHLGFRPLWDDEAFSVLVEAGSLSGVISSTVRDTTPPFFPYLLSLTMTGIGRSEFAVRFVSLLGGTLSIPVLYQLGKRLFGWREGLWAAAVMACSPFLVYFAQEARAYSWLVLMSLLSVYCFVRVILQLQTQGYATPGRWFLFSVASAAMIYTHFLAVWVLVVEGIYFLWFWWVNRRGFKLWLTAYLIIGLLFLPWVLLLLGLGLGGEVDSFAGTREFAGLRVDAPVASLLWIWQEGLATHDALSLIDTLQQALISFAIGDFIAPSLGFELAGGFLVIAFIGLVGVATRRRHEVQFPHLALFLVLYAFAPILLSYFVAFPTSRPHWAKYFITALPAFNLAVGAGLAVIMGKGRVLGAIAAVFVLVACSLSLYNYFEHPAYARNDPHPAIAYLEEFSSPKDALLANPLNRSPTFWYYYSGDLPYYSPTEWAIDDAFLSRIADKYVGLWLVENQPLDFDRDGEIERWLTYNTYRTFTNWVGPLLLRYYSMPTSSGPVVARDWAPAVRFGDRVALEGHRIGVQTGGRVQVVQLMLRWKAVAEIDAPYQIGARVVDKEGRVWGQTNSAPLGNFLPTIEWKVNEVVEDHLGLMLWPGTPPGEYKVQIWMYRDEDGSPLKVVRDDETEASELLELDTVVVGLPDWPPTVGMLSLDRMVDEEFEGFSLLGYQVDRLDVEPEDVVNLVLYWRALRGDIAAHETRLWLEDKYGETRGEGWEAPLGSDYEVPRWVEGQVVRDPRTLWIPEGLPDGAYKVMLNVKAAGGSGHGETVALLKLNVRDRAHRFSVPRMKYPQRADFAGLVELLGYDLSAEQVSRGDDIELVLYWRALADMDTSYTVFNHLVGQNGEMAGQWDGIPVGGTTPTTEWVAGEVIKDTYRVPIREESVPGHYRWFVGLYDRESGQRLQAVDADGVVVADHVVLDIPIEVH